MYYDEDKQDPKSWNSSGKIRWNDSSNFVCLGKRDGFFFKLKFIENDNTHWVDYKLKIPWCNVSQITCHKNNRNQVQLCTKICEEPIIQKIMEEEIKDNQYSLQNENKQDEMKQDEQKQEKKYTKKWKVISSEMYPESLQHFIQFPKFVFQFRAYHYQLHRIKDSILHHSKILPHQKVKYNYYRNIVKHTLDISDKNYAQNLYRSAYAPGLQSHKELSNKIYSNLLMIFNAKYGRMCKVCKKYVGHLEEHPVCIANNDTVDSCDSNIIKSIYKTKFIKNEYEFSPRRHIGMFF